MTEHVHEIETGSFDFNKPLTCPACIEYIEKARAKLCQKYGWSEWPSDLK